MNDSVGLSLAYVHGFKNAITGAIFPLLGTNTTLDSEYDALAFGLHIMFGPCPKSDACETGPSPSSACAEPHGAR